MTFAYNMNIGLWASSASTPAQNPSPVDKITMYGTYGYSGSGFNYTMTLGSASSPMTWSGLISNTITYSGTMTIDVDSGGQTATVTYASNGLTINTNSSSYPSGSMTFSIANAGSTIYSGTLTFNGTSTATLTFGGTSYSVNLLTGSATQV
jgi:hypothetical protein